MKKTDKTIATKTAKRPPAKKTKRKAPPHYPKAQARIAESKRLVLEAMPTVYGNRTLAARKAGIGRGTLWEYERDDPAFLQQMEYAARIGREMRLDVAEISAMQLVQGIYYDDPALGTVYRKDPDAGMVRFMLRTLGRDRGYSERYEHTGANGGPLQQVQRVVVEFQDFEAGLDQ